MTATWHRARGPCRSSAHQFHEKEATFWNSPLVITGFSRIHETAFRPWQSDNIPRRYCSGEAMLSDGKVRKVHYSIIEDGGFAGISDSSASIRASNGACPGSTATGRTTRPAGPHALIFGQIAQAEAAAIQTAAFVLVMFQRPARLLTVE